MSIRYGTWSGGTHRAFLWVFWGALCRWNVPYVMLRELDSGGVCKTSTHMAQMWKNILVQTFPELWQNVCVCKKVFNESIVLIFIVSATNVSWYQNMCPPTRLRAEAGSLGSMSKEPRGFGLDRRRQVPSPTLCWRQEGAYASTDVLRRYVLYESPSQRRRVFMKCSGLSAIWRMTHAVTRIMWAENLLNSASVVMSG